MSEVCLLYGTAENHEQALSIATILVEEKLAACVNILGNVTSVYRWEGAVCNGVEVSFLVKTTKSMVDDVVEKIKLHHSYECPSVLSVSVDGGNHNFLSWVMSNVSS